MNNILIIDSTAHGMHDKNSSLHVRNSYILKDYLQADLIPSDPQYLNHNKLYDKILFVSSSRHSEAYKIIDYLLENDEKNPNEVEYYYICNDYNVGESTFVWALSSKYGIKYNVIANHKGEENIKLRGVNLRERISNWHIVNLNSLIYDDSIEEPKIGVSSFFNTTVEKTDIIYFGAFRKGRIKYFKKYLDKDFPVSTSKKNIKKYRDADIFAFWNVRLNWNGTVNTLHKYKSSLYLEDEATNNWYSCLANRYYEALSYNIPSFFDASCINTIEKSGYPIDHWFIVDSKEELRKKLKLLDNYSFDLSAERAMAIQERQQTLDAIKEIVS